MNTHFRIEEKAWADYQAGKPMDLKPYDDDDSNKFYQELRQLYKPQKKPEDM